MRGMETDREGVRDMPDSDSPPVLKPCEWHPEYDEDYCEPCLAAWESYQESLEDSYREERWA